MKALHQFFSAILFAAILFALPSPAQACIWDYDTLQMERNKFPTALELITGKFLRHSKEFYQWRVKDRLKKLKKEPKKLAYYNDLAAAYDKLGQHQKAIDTMIKKEKIKPGLYKTYANLGTFYIHNGQLKKGLQYIEKAIEINPDAHFGREVYQKYLVEYVLDRKKKREGKLKLPLIMLERTHFKAEESKKETHFLDEYLAAKEEHTLQDGRLKGFGAFLEKKLKGFNRKKAIKGVLGMMKFGNHDSPILLEALADLLDPKKMQRLRVRAYLKASYEVKDKEVAKIYRALAKKAVGNQYEVGLSDMEEKFKEELAEAKEWFDQVKRDEKGWIDDENINPDEAFSEKYYQEPKITEPLVDTGWIFPNTSKVVRYVLLSAIGLFIIAFLLFIFRTLRRRLGKNDQSSDFPSIDSKRSLRHRSEKNDQG